MYMFKSLFKSTYIKQSYRKFSKNNIPTVSIVWSEKDGIKVGTKQDDQEWKATKGNGKSIFDCENELWCVPKPQPKKTDKSKKLK